MNKNAEDMSVLAKNFDELTGLEQMQLAFQSGRRPPIAETRDIDLDSIEFG
ncbi:MAG: hypothetical protein MI743_15235 [Sneathiellales bacterium]|nr:hypothetical protein [Sneathiellales bacterium]